MTTETYTVAMTDPQLANNSNHNNNSSSSNNISSSGNNSSTSNSNNSHNLQYNNNNNGESKYLHKKFKKMATSKEVAAEVKISVPEEMVLEGKNGSISPVFETSTIGESAELRKSTYACPYCKLSCAKPSVLQKHIRAHTNERPYPCVPCGFAFKTKSNLYKHCRSRAHSLKMEGTDTLKVLQASMSPSEDSDVSLSDSASNGTGTPPPRAPTQPPPPPPLPSPPPPTQSLQVSSPSGSSSLSRSPSSSPNPSSSRSPCPCPCVTTGSRPTKIYKPKFHTALQQCSTLSDATKSSPSTEQLCNHGKHIVKGNQSTGESSSQNEHQHAESTAEAAPLIGHKRSRSEDSSDTRSGSCCKGNHCATDASHCASCSDSRQSCSDLEQDAYVNLQPLSSPGPLLGNTRLVDAHQQSSKRPRFELGLPPDPSKYQRASTLQMFGGEVRILDRSGESKTMRIEPRSNGSASECHADEDEAEENASANPETASVFVRSDLHSGGTMLHKVSSATTQPEQLSAPPASINLDSIAPNISPPSLAPSVACLSYFKPGSILHGGRLIPYVPGMPGPQSMSANAQPLDLALTTEAGPGESSAFVPKTSATTVSSAVTVADAALGNKFLRPCSLPLKPGTFTPKRHHGITPTANTLALISPETPRPKKSYGQLYLNGHAYTYLGLKCSTRLFYCTLNRPQPMYVRQQHGLSMYSNWKICKEAPSELEFALTLDHYDSRQRASGYSLANGFHKDILTHSSQRPNTPGSPDSGLESDGTDRAKRVKIIDGGFESTEDYTYVRGRGRGRYVCEECGIRCKKPSMLKKHIRTHTDVRPYTCQHCAFSFKTKGNLTKHMKSKAHYKKCLELEVSPLSDKGGMGSDDKGLSQISDSTPGMDDTSSEEESEPEADADGDGDGDETDESDSEEHEAAQSLLRLARLSTTSEQRLGLPGLLSTARPATYPYNLSQTSESRLSVIRSCAREEPTVLLAPIDLRLGRLSESQRHSSPTVVVTTVSGSALLQTIVQSMERLPVQGRNWPAEPTDGQMLQAYLTERHLMDSKLKQQYRVENKEPKAESFQKQEPVDEPRLKTNIPNFSIEQEDLFIPKSTSLTQLEFRPTSKLVNNCLNLSMNSEYNVRQQQQLLSQKITVTTTATTVIMNVTSTVSVNSTTTDTVTVSTGSRFRSISPHSTTTALSKAVPEFFQPSSTNTTNYVNISEDTHNVCSICNKAFSKLSQLRLHINIHYFERPYRCESCGTSFRTKGHLTKHERSTLHHNKVNMTSTFGAATASNPRPFKCTDCKSAFRIHGHLAKHLRSKMHIMKLECLRKLPFGTYAEMERSGINLNDIDTTDCDTSLASLQIMARKLCEKDPKRLGKWEMRMVANNPISGGESSSEEGDANNSHPVTQSSEVDVSKNYYITMCSKTNLNLVDVKVDELTKNLIYKCQMCPISFKSLSELQIHCFVEHHIELSNTSKVHALTNVEETILERDNIHNFKKTEKCTVRKNENSQEIDAT